MRSPLLLLLLSLQIIQLAQSSYSSSWTSWNSRLNFCPVLLQRYGQCLGYAIIIRYYPHCCLHPAFQGNQNCRWIQSYRRKKRSVGGCNPTEHVVVVLGNTNNRWKRADLDFKQPDHFPDTSYGSSEVSDNSLWNITDKSTNNLPSMLLETGVTNRNTSLDVPKYRIKRQSTPGPPVFPASLMYELADNGRYPIMVTCCGDSTTKYCGAGTGIKCSTVCGHQTVDAVDVVESNDVCDPEITGGDAGRRRRKRSWSASTMASWRINWCPRTVTSSTGGNIWYYRICCFHPAVQKHGYTYYLPEASDADEKTVGTFCHHKVSKMFKKTRKG